MFKPIEEGDIKNLHDAESVIQFLNGQCAKAGECRTSQELIQRLVFGCLDTLIALFVEKFTTSGVYASFKLFRECDHPFRVKIREAQKQGGANVALAVTLEDILFKAFNGALAIYKRGQGPSLSLQDRRTIATEGGRTWKDGLQKHLKSTNTATQLLEFDTSSVFSGIPTETLLSRNMETVALLKEHQLRLVPDGLVIQSPINLPFDYTIILERGVRTFRMVGTGNQSLVNKDALFIRAVKGHKNTESIEKKKVHQQEYLGEGTFFETDATFDGLNFGTAAVELVAGTRKYIELEAIMLLVITPVVASERITESVYANYNLELRPRETRDESGREGAGGGSSETLDSQRTYPYGRSDISSIAGNSAKNEEIREAHRRVNHKRLLPLLKRQSGVIAYKPSQKAKENASRYGFTLSVGIEFIDNGEVIYPDEIPELLRVFNVGTVDEFILTINGSNPPIAYIRHETFVSSSTDTIGGYVRGRVRELYPKDRAE